MDQLSRFANQLIEALTPSIPSQSQLPSSTTVKVEAVDDQNKSSAFTTCATNSIPVSPTSVPVLTSAAAPGITSTQPGSTKQESLTEQPTNAEMICGDRGALLDVLEALERGNCSATELAITPYAIGDEEMKRLAKALSVAGNRVADIKLVTTKLGKEGFDALADLLGKSLGLHALGITDCNGNDERPWQSFAHALAENTTLKSLTIFFSGSDRGLHERKSIYRALETNKGLRNVALTSSHMDAEASGILANSLRANPRIENLELFGRSFRADAKHTSLMEAIASHPALGNVSLGAALSQRDLHRLMSGLKNNQVLKALTVNFSNLCGKAHDAIFVNEACDMLKNNATLQELNIRDHMLSDPGVWSLSNALKENRTLQRLDLYHLGWQPGSAMTEMSARALSDMLDDNKVIQHIAIGFFEQGENGWCLADESHPAKQELRDKLAKNHAHQ